MHFACVTDDSLDAARVALERHYTQLCVNMSGMSREFSAALEAEQSRTYRILQSFSHQYSGRPKKVLITTRDIDSTVLLPCDAIIGALDFADVSLNDLKRITEVAKKTGKHVIIVADYDHCYSVIWRCNESTVTT